MWKSCGNVNFPQRFGRFAQNYPETMRSHKILGEIRWNLG